MDSFADFFKRTVGVVSGKGERLALPSQDVRAVSKGLNFQGTSNGDLATVSTNEGTDITEVYKAAVATVRTESFVNDLSHEVGTPYPGETEDAFTKRAMDVARDLLRKRLPK